MDKVIEVEKKLSKINTFVTVYSEFKSFHNASGSRLKFRQKVEVFRDFCSAFSSLKNFFPEHIINTVDEKLQPLLKSPTELSSSENNFLDEESALNDFYKAIDNLPKLREVSIQLPKNINKEDFLDLINLLMTKYGIFLDFINSEDFINKTSLMSSSETQSKLISLYNSLISMKSPDVINNFISCNEYFKVITNKSKIKEAEKKRVLLEQENQKKESYLEKLKQKAIEVERTIATQSNTRLQEVFDNEAKSLNLKIDNLHNAIFAFFMLLLLVIFTAAVMVYTHEFLPIEKFYIFYLSIFLTVTAILTYLIKERNRIVKYQHYCQISYLEISALADYTAQLDDKVKTEDLKIQLAHKYFQGPNGNTNQADNEKDLSFFSSKLNELTNMVKDLKSLVDK